MLKAGSQTGACHGTRSIAITKLHRRHCQTADAFCHGFGFNANSIRHRQTHGKPHSVQYEHADTVQQNAQNSPHRRSTITSVVIRHDPREQTRRHGQDVCRAGQPALGHIGADRPVKHGQNAKQNEISLGPASRQSARLQPRQSVEPKENIPRPHKA